MNKSHDIIRLWSQLAHVQLDLHRLVSHLHDIGLSALAAAIVMLGVVILLELRSVARMRQVMDRSLARVFEQLDLVRFETQLLEERRQSPGLEARLQFAVAHPARAQIRTQLPTPLQAQAQTQVPTQTPLSIAREAGAVPNLQPAATIGTGALSATSAPAPAPAHELAERRSLSSGEARLLSSLAEARARAARERGARLTA